MCLLNSSMHRLPKKRSELKQSSPNYYSLLEMSKRDSVLGFLVINLFYFFFYYYSYYYFFNL